MIVATTVTGSDDQSMVKARSRRRATLFTAGIITKQQFCYHPRWSPGTFVTNELLIQEMGG